MLYIGLLVFDGFPWGLVVVGLLTHLLYGSLLTTFPVISLLSPGFVGGTCECMYGSGITVHMCDNEVWGRGVVAKAQLLYEVSVL